MPSFFTPCARFPVLQVARWLSDFHARIETLPAGGCFLRGFTPQAAQCDGYVEIEWVLRVREMS